MTQSETIVNNMIRKMEKGRVIFTRPVGLLDTTISIYYGTFDAKDAIFEDEKSCQSSS